MDLDGKDESSPNSPMDKETFKLASQFSESSGKRWQKQQRKDSLEESSGSAVDHEAILSIESLGKGKNEHYPLSTIKFFGKRIKKNVIIRVKQRRHERFLKNKKGENSCPS